MDTELIFSAELISRYEKSGPRYTSYPTAIQFNEEFNSKNYIENALRTNENPLPQALSLYFHLPFCSTVCYYCACNKIITNNRRHAKPYLELMFRELEMQSALFDKDRSVRQLHWGGGTPTFISTKQMSDLMDFTRSHFSLLNDDSGEYSIELDPRESDPKNLSFLRQLGFNRISLGVQDFDPDVQRSVNRIQSEKETYSIIEAAREQGFKSVSLDLIYGLPRQNVESFSQTLNKVIAMQPDRISIFSYAHMPERFKVQKQINELELPNAATKLAIYQNNIKTLIRAGYVYIGMDHFAKAEDELAIAQTNKELTRNFQGYSTHGDCDVVEVGVSAISKIGDCYAQNFHDVTDYENSVNASIIPTLRGFRLDSDDILRRYVITQLICHFSIIISDIEDKFMIDFSEYFYNELQALKKMEKDNLVSIDLVGITISPTGRLLARNICMVFDKYLRQTAVESSFSKTI